MLKKIITTIMMVSVSFSASRDLTLEQKEQIDNQVLEEFAKIIFSNAMEAKRAFQESQVREVPIENFATTAPRADFVANADISEELAAGVESATIFVSTDGQSTWQSSSATPLGTEGYETTWESAISTSDGNSAHSYLSGVVNSEVLGENFGSILVSGSPHRGWPLVNSNYLTAVLVLSNQCSDRFSTFSVEGG